jgi:hypothetical protein
MRMPATKLALGRKFSPRAQTRLCQEDWAAAWRGRGKYGCAGLATLAWQLLLALPLAIAPAMRTRRTMRRGTLLASTANWACALRLASSC